MTSDEIEFIGVADRDREASHEVVATRSLVRFWPLVVLVGVGVWALVSSGRVDTPDPEPDLGPSPTVAPISPMLDNDQAIGGADDVTSTELAAVGEPTPWPSPPLDRDPYVVRLPGRLETPLGTPDRTIVYINSVGSPTVVSFGNGDVYEVGVAAMRVHETFAVEEGEVRSLEGANAALPDATASSVVFHTFRDVDPPGVGSTGDGSGVGRGPELCLSATSCATPDQGVNGRAVGTSIVERFDSEQHADVASIIAGWQPVDRWLVSPDAIGCRFRWGPSG